MKLVLSLGWSQPWKDEKKEMKEHLEKREMKQNDDGRKKNNTS